MNIPQEQIEETGYKVHFETNQNVLERLFGHSELICSYDTYQFPDYSKVVCDLFDPIKKLERKKNIFPHDLGNAFEMGVRLVKSE